MSDNSQPWITYSSTVEMQILSVITPRQTLQGHTSRVRGVVHLPGGQRIITSSSDSSLRLWDLESGAQIGEDWKDEGDNAGVYTIALSPNGSTVSSGSDDGKVRLWDVKTGKVIAKWTGHTKDVWTVCWIANGERVLSGSADGTARVWHVKSGKTVLTINTGHQWVGSVMYSPNSKKFATGGYDETGVKIWKSKTGKLISTLEHTWPVYCLAWTSDGKKIISASYDLITIFDISTLQQITQLYGHKHLIRAITLSPDDRLLASASWDKTARLWNLDTNLPLGPPIQHNGFVECAAFSADGKLLVTGCEDSNTYVHDVHDILKAEDPLSNTNDELEREASSDDASGMEHTPRSSQDIADKSFLDADATRGISELPPTFFDDMQFDVHSSAKGDAHPLSSASALFGRISSFLHRSRPDSDEATRPPQPPRPSGLHPRVLVARLSSLIHHSPPNDDAAKELQRDRSRTRPAGTVATTAQSRPLSSWALLMLFLCCASPQKAKQTQQQPQVQVQAKVLLQPQPAAASTSITAHTTLETCATVQSRRVPLRARFVLFLCCASPPHDDGH